MNREHLENSDYDQGERVIVLTKPISARGLVWRPALIIPVALVVVLSVGLGWYLLQANGITGFPRLKEALYVGSAHVRQAEDSRHADFLLINGTEVSTLTIIPFITGGLATQAPLPQAASDPFLTKLTTRDGVETEMLSLYGEETKGSPGDYQGTLRGEKGESGGWTFHPLQALPFPTDIRTLQEVAQLRAQVKDLEDEVVALHSSKRQLEEQRREVQIRQKAVELESKQATEQDSSPESIQNAIDSLRAEETMLIQTRARSIRFSDRGRAIDLGEDSLDRELRWIEAQLTKSDQPVFIDASEQEKFNQAKRTKELELLIAQEEKLITKLLDGEAAAVESPLPN